MSKRVDKKNRRPRKPVAKDPRSLNWWQRYQVQRDEFYVQNPHSRILIGMLIVGFALVVAVRIRQIHEVIVGATLAEEGIDYTPSVIPTGTGMKK